MDNSVDFQEVCQQLPLGIFILDAGRRIRFWNEWLAAKTEVDAERALGRTLDELYTGLRSERFYWAVDQAIGYKIPQLLSQTLNRYLIPIAAGHGNRHGLAFMQQQVKVLPLAGRDGADYALVIVQDVTETVLRSAAMSELMQRFKEVSVRDPLTDLFNRRFMWEWLQHHIKEAQRYRGELACLMMDIDRFKGLNDTYGHQRGDEILKTFAHLVGQELRESDILVRYGGEEFAAFLPKCDLAGAVATAQRILERVREHGIGGLAAGEVTCSIGAAVYDPLAPCSPEALLSEADRQLYEAKNSGRNRVLPPPQVFVSAQRQSPRVG